MVCSAQGLLVAILVGGTMRETRLQDWCPELKGLRISLEAGKETLTKVSLSRGDFIWVSKDALELYSQWAERKEEIFLVGGDSMNRHWDMGWMRRLGTCRGDSGGEWKAPLGGLIEGVYLCLVYVFFYLRLTWHLIYIFSGPPIVIGPLWADSEIRMDGWVRNNLCGLSSSPLESGPRRGAPPRPWFAWWVCI